MGECESKSKHIINNYNNNNFNNNNNNINNNYNEENIPVGAVEPIPRKVNKIVDNQLEFYICKIYTSKGLGTGFLCRIPYPDEFNLLPVLITNQHVLDKDEIIKNKALKITFNNDKISKIIELTDNRKIYSSKFYYTTIIEIFPVKDNLTNFLELNNLNEIINKESIYILQYPEGKIASVSYGKIDTIDGFDITYNASTLHGSSGGPIINLNNYKIFGIHKGSLENINIGTLLKYPIHEFIFNLEKNRIKINTKIVNNIKNNDKALNPDAHQKVKNNISEYSKLMRLKDKTPLSNNFIYCSYLFYQCDEIILMHDYNLDVCEWPYEIHNLYWEASKKNKNFFEENIVIYINNQKVKFSSKYKKTNPEEKMVDVKFIFKRNITNLSFLFYKCKNLEKIDLSSFDTSNVTDMSYMFSNCDMLFEIDGLSSINTINVRKMECMFRNAYALQTLDLYFNTINVKNMKSMFNNCKLLKSLNLSFNSSKVKDMSYMFNNCSKLESLNLSFNTTNVKDMSYMFNNCWELKSLDLSSFNTENVEDMKNMFESCKNLKSINLSSFNTKNVEDMKNMFQGCESLESLNLSTFNTEKVQYMDSMFEGCKSLKSIDLSSFDIEGVNSMLCMFKKCESLESLNLSSFKNSDREIVMIQMFDGCKSLKALDLSSFNPKNKMPMDNIFRGCESLTKKMIKSKNKQLKEEINF